MLYPAPETSQGPQTKAALEGKEANGMKAINVGVRIKRDTWEGMKKPAALINRTRNNLIGLLGERVNSMSEEELLVFLHPVLHPTTQSPL